MFDGARAGFEAFSQNERCRVGLRDLNVFEGSRKFDNSMKTKDAGGRRWDFLRLVGTRNSTINNMERV